MRRKGISFAVLTAVASSLVVAGSAQATFHENLIREVHEGGVSGDYVELQSYAAGQNLVAGKHIVSYDAGGGPAPLTDFTIPSNVGNGANQATILIANTATVGGVTADFNAGLNLNVDNTGGTVCFTDSSITAKLDCVAFDGAGNGSVTVPAGANFGAPFALPGANLDGQSLIRTISRGCATALDTADDTNSAADFSLGTGSPRNNSATPTETQCPPSQGTTPKKKCKKKHKKKTGAYSAKKKCKKKKH
jgi:hypothetical protein